MAGDDTLTSLGAKITDVFTKMFAISNPNASLVFLPFGLAPPAGIIQPKSATDATPVVNAAQMAAFLADNFDEPYLMSADEGAAHGKDGFYGRLSQIYPLAVTLAQPTADAGSDARKAVTAELAMAQSMLTPAGMAYAMVASPDDWASPGNTAYWSKFDSVQTKEPAASVGPSPSASGGHTLSPRLWLFKAAEMKAVASPALEYLHAVRLPQRAPDLPAAKTAPILAREALVVRPAQELATTAALAQHAAISLAQRSAITEALARAVRPEGIARTLRQAEEVRSVRHISIDITPNKSDPPPAPPPPSSSLSMHFDYMSVGIGYHNAGISMWNGVFIANPNWCVPGMIKGGLLPSPSIAAVEGQPSLSYGMPVALIVVRNLTVTVTWSGQEGAALQDSGGFIGPFSLAGAKPVANAEGSCTYAQPGMQVVALLCARLPVLPPQDAPDAAAAPASKG